MVEDHSEYAGEVGPEELHKRIEAKLRAASDIRASNMAGPCDTDKWNKAKRAAREGYPGLSEDNEKFWKIVETIYKNEGGK